MNEETTAIEVEAAEVPVEDKCQVRDSNISKSLAFVVCLWPWSVLRHYR